MDEFLDLREPLQADGSVATPSLVAPNGDTESTASDTAPPEPMDTDHLFLSALCEILREQRERICMSQEDLASKAKLHRTYISDIERGMRNFSVKTLSRIAASLGLVTADLVRWADKRVQERLERQSTA